MGEIFGEVTRRESFRYGVANLEPAISLGTFSDFPSTVLRTASVKPGNLPRAKNSPPDCFCTSVRTGAALSIPVRQKNKGHHKVSFIFW